MTDKCPEGLLVNAVLPFTFLINRMPSGVLGGKTSIQCYAHHPLFFQFLRLLDVYFVHISNQQRDKLVAKAGQCIFLGYPSSQKGYKCNLPKEKKEGNLLVWMWHFF